MQQAIKFRGIQVGTDDFIYGDLIRIGDDFFIYRQDYDTGVLESGLFSVIPETVGQFIGLQDWNKVDIYIGDKVKHINGGFIDEVVFGKIGHDSNFNGLTGFALKSWEYHYHNYGHYDLCYGFSARNLIVVGNIHKPV